MSLNTFIKLFIPLIFLVACNSQKDTVSSKQKTKEATVLNEKQKLELDFLFHEANKQRLLGNYEQALVIYSKCVKINPNQPFFHYELANLYNMANQQQIALQYAEKAVQLDPNNKWYRLQYAQSLQESGDTESAIKQYHKLIELEPENVDLYFDLARMQLYSEKYKDALINLDEIEKRIGISEEIIRQKEKIYIKLNDIESAAAEVQKLIDAYPDEIHYKGLLADLYLANEMPEKAFAIYQKILEKDPQNPYAHLSLYDYYKAKNENEKALEEAKLAFQSPNLDIDTKVQILLSYYSLSDKSATLKKEAFELNKILIKTHPEEAKAYTIYADFLLRENKLEGAKENYLKAIEFDNSRYPIWNQLLFLQSELNDKEGLERDSKRAVELFPNQPIPYLFYGVIQLENKNYKEATEYLEIGKDYVIDNPLLKTQFYATLGDAYNSMKLYEKSDAAYEKALKIDGKNIHVLNNYSYFLSLRGEKLEHAEKLSALCNELEPNQPNYLDTYAWILYKQGKYVQAKEWLEKAVSVGGDKSAVILEHLGDVLYQLNQPEEAMKYWNKAKESGEGSEWLDKKIAEGKLYE
ncbi:MAG: tetratricopeptide repeat protein [Flavobacteriales bacterium]|nr:tetratricopeptide repeat protein [Flavobacteriales bacterium]MCW8913702.1 tetratricopeptide repeat protein [Flavobacteriales bacterium]MCW8937874.1 tetratricopeptide repeat protein [Flavobacteriales bacterium]MCW8940385.1 tetratricopeptide repeat protein [Flavobacteriales bacterium]MCW8967306.1 tetratricopeptide repeat protein [Flavobacteriales bacterium]